jgi:hypothetical protein
VMLLTFSLPRFTREELNVSFIRNEGNKSEYDPYTVKTIEKIKCKQA